MMDKKYVVGIDIGGTNFRIGLVSQDGELSHFQKKPSAPIFGECATERLAEEIESYLKEIDHPASAVVIGVPSVVSRDKKTILNTPNLEGFNNINIVDPLSERLQIPVYMDRDVHFLLQNDLKSCSLDEKSTVIGIYIGTGYGNSLYINGQFLYGKNGVAGEMGHTPLYGLHRDCPCGNNGCVELLCSGKHLQELRQEYFPDTDISEIFSKYRSDPVLVEYVKTLALPIATEITLFDPDTVVIAGGVLFMKDFPKDLLLSEIIRNVRKPYPAENLDVRFPQHRQESGVLGGAIYAFHKLKEEQKL